jgi:hypothetical protein
MFPALAFRRAGNPVVFYALDVSARVQVLGESDRAQLQFAGAEVRVLDPANFLLTLPVANGGALTNAQKQAAAATDQTLYAADMAAIQAAAGA